MLFFSQILSVQRCVLILVILGFVLAAEKKSSVRKIPQVVKSWVGMPLRMVRSLLTKLGGIVSPKTVRSWESILESTVEEFNNNRWSNEDKDALKDLIGKEISSNVGLKSLEEIINLQESLSSEDSNTKVAESTFDVEKLLLEQTCWSIIAVLSLSRSINSDLGLIKDTLIWIRLGLYGGRKIVLSRDKSSDPIQTFIEYSANLKLSIKTWREEIKASEKKERTRFRLFQVRSSKVQKEIDKSLSSDIQVLQAHMATRLGMHHQSNDKIIEQYEQMLKRYGKARSILLHLKGLYKYVIEEYIKQSSLPDTSKPPDMSKVLDNGVNENIWNHIKDTVVPKLLKELKSPDSLK